MEKKVYIYVGIMVALMLASFVWINREKEIASACSIQSVPTIFFCPMNATPQVVKGAMAKESVKKTITEFLLKK